MKDIIKGLVVGICVAAVLVPVTITSSLNYSKRVQERNIISVQKDIEVIFKEVPEVYDNRIIITRIIQANLRVHE